jgi:hypothetical protein
MRSKFGRLVSLFVLAVVVSVTPAFAEGCSRCWTYQTGESVAVMCTAVRGYEMGNLKCQISCYSNDSIAYCECQELGDWCMSIVVEG